MREFYMYHTSWIWSKLLFSLDDSLPIMDLVLHFCGFWDVEREMKACTVNPWWRERGRNECSLSFRHPNILEVIPMFGLVHKGKGAMGPHEIFLSFFFSFFFSLSLFFCVWVFINKDIFVCAFGFKFVHWKGLGLQYGYCFVWHTWCTFF